MKYPEFSICLPKWIEGLSLGDQTYPSVDERIRLVITLSRLNVKNGTGGPFGAGIFDNRTNELVAPGVNLVVLAKTSIAHAEIVAIVIAQKMLGRYALGSDGQSYDLVCSTEPCAMCFGAVPWSGVARVVCAARSEDAQAIGFDEGAKPPNWEKKLETRNISVLRDIMRDEACSVLREYKQGGGIIYGGQQADVNRNNQ